MVKDRKSLKYLEKLFLFNKNFKNENPDQTMMYLIGNNLKEKLNFEKNSYFDSENKALLKHFDEFKKIKTKINNLRKKRLKKKKINGHCCRFSIWS